MPRIQIVAADGTSFQVDSSDPKILAPWIWETIARTRPDSQYPVTVRVHGLWVDRSVESVDWPSIAMEFFATLGEVRPVDNVRRLIEELGRYVDQVEARP